MNSPVEPPAILAALQRLASAAEGIHAEIRRVREMLHQAKAEHDSDRHANEIAYNRFEAALKRRRRTSQAIPRAAVRAAKRA